MSRTADVHGVVGKLAGLARGMGVGPEWRSTFPGFLRWFALFVCVVGFINVWMLQSELAHQREARERGAWQRITPAANGIGSAFRSVIADLQFLDQSAGVRQVADGVDGARQALAGDLVVFSTAHRWYDQVRYIDIQGRERVRVDYRDGRASAVADDELQDKSARYYFTETARLERGEVYISPLDLNVERGEIELPQKPMIRFGTPVFDSNGEKQGVVVLNFLARELIDTFRRSAAGESTRVYLLNADGYWLASPDPGDEWGFMYPDRQGTTFAQRHPAVWREALARPSGTVSASGETFVFSTLDLASLQRQALSAAGGSVGPPSDAVTDHRWIVVEHYRQPSMLDVIASPMAAGQLLLSVLLAAVGAWFVARSMRQASLIMQHRLSEATREARETIRTLSQAVEQSPVSIVLTDPQGNIEYVNRGFQVITGYTAAEVLGKNPSILKSGHASDRTYSELWNTIRAGSTWRGELCNRRKDGPLYWVRAAISPVLDDHGDIKHFLAVEEDCSREKSQEDQILHQAHFDYLTELPNRFLAVDRLKQMLKVSQRDEEQVAVLFLDADDFKKINDTLGHDVGDQVLVEAARRLRANVRDGDTVARLGGDEFVVLLGALAHRDDAGRVAGHLLEAFRAPFIVEGYELTLTLSIGIAISPHDGSEASAVMRNADAAMYRAKQDGRDTYRYFAAAMNQDTVRRMAVEARLRDALQRNDLVVHYQPIVDLASGRVGGAEALLRWHDEELGDVSPVEFIPVAEQSSLINVIGLYVLSESVRQAVAYRRQAGDDLYISVNVSPSQLHDPGFVSYVEAVLRESGLPGDALMLEITEGVLLRGDPRVDRVLGRLHDLGVRLAMDDFGTGYSSLGYLRRYPFDVIKIDRSFVNDIVTDVNDRHLVRAALQMAQALELTVVAEGVEHAEERDLLLGWGCDLGQGYLFGRPVTAAAFAALLAEQRRPATLPGAATGV